MSRLKKLTAFVLAFIVCFSAFSVCTFALEDPDTNAVLKAYEKDLQKSIKKGHIKAQVERKVWAEADYSSLSESDVKLTKLRDGDKYSPENKDIQKDVEYFSAKDDEDTGFNDIYTTFSIKNDFDSFFLDLESAAVKDVDGGDKYTFKCTDTYDDSKWTYTVFVRENKDGSRFVEEYTLKTESYSTKKSIALKNYDITSYEVVNYKLQYENVPVKSITLSKDEIHLSYKQSEKIYVSIEPGNASFKDFYYVIEYADGDTFYDEIVYNTADDGMGTIEITGVGKGTAQLSVYSINGECSDTCTVYVEFSFFDHIRFMFDKMFSLLFGSFGI